MYLVVVFDSESTLLSQGFDALASAKAFALSIWRGQEVSSQIEKEDQIIWSSYTRYR